MTRCLLRSIITTSGVDSEALYLQNAEVYVFRTGTTTTPVMYAGPTGGSALTNPILSDGNGEIDVWLDPAESNIVDIRVDSNGGNAYLANQPSKRQNFTTFTKTLQAGGPQGVPGGPGSPGVTALEVDGTVATSSALPGSASTGDLWIATDTHHGWVWSAGHWVDVGPIVGPGVPSAGTTSQALVKASGTDFDTTWHTLTAGDVSAVAKVGDTMTGPLVLPADPTTQLQAGPKQYIDRTATHRNTDRLRTFHAALANRANAPVDVLAIGDSITEGYGTTSIHKRWLERRAATMQSVFGGGTGVYYPVMQGSGITRQAGDPWTVTGGTPYYATALGFRAWYATSSSDYATCTATCDRFTLLYTKSQFTTTNLAVWIDGVAVATIDTYNAAGPIYGNQWDSGPLPYGPHTIAFYDFTGGLRILEGVMVEQRCRPSGFRLWDCSQSGYLADTFAAAAANVWDQPIQNVKPSLVTIALGVNDMAYARTPAQISADVATTANRAIAATVAGGAPTPSVVIVAEWQTTTYTAAQWGPVVAALRTLADTNGWVFTDVGLASGLLTPAGTDPLGLSGDGTHPSDKGARLWDDHGARVLDVGAFDKPPAPTLDVLAKVPTSNLRRDPGIQFDDAFEYPDGNLNGLVAPTGQTWAATTATPAVTVTGGQALVAHSTSANSYASVDLGALFGDHLAFNFVIGTGTTDTAFVGVGWSQASLSTTNGLFYAVWRTGWSLGSYATGVGTTLASGTLTLTADGATTYSAAVTRVGPNSIAMRHPDGTVTQVTNAAIGSQVGRYLTAWWAENSTSDRIPALRRVLARFLGTSQQFTANINMPWLVDVDVFMTAIASTNWDTVGTYASLAYNAWKLSTGAQNAEINFDVVLAAGTWTLEGMYSTSTNTGIVTYTLGGSSLTSLGGSADTFDTYSAASVYNVRSAVTGIVVPTSGLYRLKLKMATKNASSSSYYGILQHLQFRRTA